MFSEHRGDRPERGGSGRSPKRAASPTLRDGVILEGERAVHMGFASVQLGVEEQLEVEPRIVQTDGDGRTGAVAAERV
jgi:hypothetical protein